ncbi:MAG: hypothetical protein ACE5JM_00110 [Armatimonadota bacterium]
MHRRWILSTLIPLLALALATSAFAQRPAILFQTRHEESHGGEIDYTYLSELHAKGFDVDYLDFHRDFTWDRVKNYNCLVIQFCPPSAEEVGMDWMRITDVPLKRDFIDILDRYLDAGGGVFVMAYVVNRKIQLLADVLERWGARIPLELIRDPDNVAPMRRMPRERLAFTDQILPSPVSDGVAQFWYPYSERPHYNAGNTNALVVSDDWQVVARASKTSRTEPIDLTKSAMPAPPDVLVREGVEEPILFAVRPHRAGRIALTSQYPQFSWGQGTQWLYDREVLSKGLQDKRSDFGQLLENTYRWLSEPSIKSGKVGGYRQDIDRLRPPNMRRDAKEGFEEIFWGEAEERLHRPARGELYKGLIGVQTSLSTGSGSIADFARAARQAGLDFIVLMEDSASLTDEKLEQMKRECEANSDDTLQVFPGYTIDNNIGNHLFIFGKDPTLPPDRCLTGPDSRLLNQQYQTPDGEFPRPGLTVVLDWLLYNVKRGDNQIGFYDFAESGQGMRMKDLRTYGMAAVRFYRGGQLVEDVTDEYLLTAQGTIPPAPAAVNLVRSPDELIRDVRSGSALTYAQARSPATLFDDALHYSSQYDGLNVFLSDGPLIKQWPACYRVHTFAKEAFVTGRNVMVSPIHVTSERGLKEITIYNGRDLFRRFKLAGHREFRKTLLLNATIHKNLVLIAEDVDGGRAVSFARRCWKVGHGFAFCGDRVNDCGDMLLAHGAGGMRVVVPPKIHGGATWDGGPKGEITLADFEASTPILTTDAEREGHRSFNQTPLLEFTDEGARVVRKLKHELIADHVPSVNPWHTYGPMIPSRLMDLVQTYAGWHTPTVRVLPAGHAGYGLHHGIKPALYTCTIAFKRDMAVRSLQLLRQWKLPQGYSVRLAISTSEGLEALDLDTLPEPAQFLLSAGDWFGVYSPQATNSHLFVIRSGPIRLQARKPPGGWLSLWAPIEGTEVQAGETYHFELFSLGYPLDVAVDEAEDFVRTMQYLREPRGMDLLRGQMMVSHGTIELVPEGYVAEVRLPRPPEKTHLTLPMRLRGLNRRWSAGLFMREGYVQGHYGPGRDRYRPLGIDLDGMAYVPIYADLADATHLVIGHPVVADDEGRELFIQVTQTSGGTGGEFKWWIAVNNPTDRTITTTLSNAMRLEGIRFDRTSVTVASGEHLVIQE